MRLLFSILILGIASFLNTSCGGHSTTIVVVEETPNHAYTIEITRMAALNPVGDIYVSIYNIYNINDPLIISSTNQVAILNDRNDSQPITFELKDFSNTVIIFETFTFVNLTSPKEVDVIAPNEIDSFSFRIQ